MERILSIATAVGTAVSNTATESSLASYAFAAGALLPGKSYRARCGVRATATNGTDTLALGVRFGTTSATPASNTSCGASAAVDVANNDVAIVDVQIDVHSTTRAVATVLMAEPDATGTIAIKSFGPTVLTIAAETAYYLDVTCTWSAASASDSAQAETWVVTELT